MAPALVFQRASRIDRLTWMTPSRTRRFGNTLAGLPLAAQFVLALTAVIAAGFAVAMSMIWYEEYAETHGPFMSLLIGGAVLIASVTAFFVWANGSTERQHARFTPEDVQSAVENYLGLHGDDHDEWDLFLGFSIDDPYLESVRQRCVRLWDDDDLEPADPRVRGELEKILQELRSRVSRG